MSNPTWVLRCLSSKLYIHVMQASCCRQMSMAPANCHTSSHVLQKCLVMLPKLSCLCLAACLVFLLCFPQCIFVPMLMWDLEVAFFLWSSSNGMIISLHIERTIPFLFSCWLLPKTSTAIFLVTLKQTSKTMYHNCGQWKNNNLHLIEYTETWNRKM